MARKQRDYRAEYLARNERAKAQGKTGYAQLRREKERVKKFLGQYEQLLEQGPVDLSKMIPSTRLEKIALLRERGADDELVSGLMETAANKDAKFWQEWREAYDKVGSN